MQEILIFTAVLLGVSNFHYFLFFRRERKQLKLKIYVTILLTASIILSVYIIRITPGFFYNEVLQNCFFLVLMNFLIPGYFLMLYGINSVLENIPIIRGYFTFNVIFGTLFLSASMLYYFLSVFILSFRLY
jgi:uncharacterized membrane protein YidH (DUF202 family)